MMPVVLHVPVVLLSFSLARSLHFQSITLFFFHSSNLILFSSLHTYSLALTFFAICCPVRWIVTVIVRSLRSLARSFARLLRIHTHILRRLLFFPSLLSIGFVFIFAFSSLPPTIKWLHLQMTMLPVHREIRRECDYVQPCTLGVTIYSLIRILFLLSYLCSSYSFVMCVLYGAPLHCAPVCVCSSCRNDVDDAWAKVAVNIVIICCCWRFSCVLILCVCVCMPCHSGYPYSLVHAMCICVV